MLLLAIDLIVQHFYTTSPPPLSSILVFFYLVPFLSFLLLLLFLTFLQEILQWLSYWAPPLYKGTQRWIEQFSPAAYSPQGNWCPACKHTQNRFFTGCIHLCFHVVFTLGQQKYVIFNVCHSAWDICTPLTADCVLNVLGFIMISSPAIETEQACSFCNPNSLKPLSLPPSYLLQGLETKMMVKNIYVFLWIYVKNQKYSLKV